MEIKSPEKTVGSEKETVTQTIDEMVWEARDLIRDLEQRGYDVMAAQKSLEDLLETRKQLFSEQKSADPEINKPFESESLRAKAERQFLAIKKSLKDPLSPMRGAKDKMVETIEDSMITAKVKAKFLVDNVLPSLKIQVTTIDGVVYLSGKAGSEKEMGRAIELASSIEGVKDVDATGMTIEVGGHLINDMIVTAKIKGLFLRELLFGDKEVPVVGIHVETNDGVVTLSGSADTIEQARNAKHLAISIKGVKEVNSNISIKD